MNSITQRICGALERKHISLWIDYLTFFSMHTAPFSLSFCVWAPFWCYCCCHAVKMKTIIIMCGGCKIGLKHSFYNTWKYVDITAYCGGVTITINSFLLDFISRQSKKVFLLRLRKYLIFNESLVKNTFDPLIASYKQNNYNFSIVFFFALN